MEDHLSALKTEYAVLKERWFIGEQMDPVFESVVRQFCDFDNLMQELYKTIEAFMRVGGCFFRIRGGFGGGLQQPFAGFVVVDEKCWVVVRMIPCPQFFLITRGPVIWKTEMPKG